MAEPSRCPECDGAGFVAPPTELTRGVWPPDEAPPPVCPVCGGTGKLAPEERTPRR
jgi:hypothetical protein